MQGLGDAEEETPLVGGAPAGEGGEVEAAFENGAVGEGKPQEVGGGGDEGAAWRRGQKEVRVVRRGRGGPL